MQNHFSLAKEAPCPMKQPSHLHRDLVEATVRRVLAGVRTDPERELRKLVDLGADVSRGRFQRRFLTAAQHLLEDPDSSYYAIARELLSQADFDRLVAFGMALGYDGCTRGARLIRQIEAEHGFNIPWALSLETESARLSGGELDRWTALIAEGTRLGIHAYLLRCDDPAAAVPLAARQKNCAFLLFVRPDETGPRLLAALGKAPTCAVSVELAPGVEQACAALRQAGILHGVHWTYAALPEIRSGSWAGAVRHTGAPFGILIPGRCPEETQQEVYRWVCARRAEQRLPFVPIELRQDLRAIDRVVSDDDCAAGFGPDGQLLRDGRRIPGEDANCFAVPPDRIFARYLKK